MNDLVKRLRDSKAVWSDGKGIPTFLESEAADEIERLSARPEALRIPDGYMLVPVEPDALVLSRIPGANPLETYRAIMSLANLRTASISVASWACAAEADGQRCEKWCRDEANCVAVYSRTDWRPHGADAKRPSDEWYRQKIDQAGENEPTVIGGTIPSPLRQNPLLAHDCRDNMACRICGSLSIAALIYPLGEKT